MRLLDQLPPELKWAMRRPEVRRLAITTGAGLLFAIVYLLLAPTWYSSTLSVVPAAPSKGPASPFAGVLGAAADLPFDLGGSADIERIAAVLKSTSVTDATINKLDLLARYKRRYLEHARKDLWQHCSIATDRKAKVVTLTCEDTDPAFVKSLLEFLGAYGNEVFRRVSSSSASEEVRFLEKRVAEMQVATNEAAQRLREFEEKHKIVDLDTQSKAVVSAMASLRSQEISKELELAYLNSFSSREEATAQQLRQQLAVLRSKARSLEDVPPPKEGATAQNPGENAADVFPPALTVPKVRFELEELYRNRKLQETNLVLLMQRLETAKVNEARDTPTFVILDSPALPTYRSRPKRLVVLGIGVFLGLLFGLAWLFGPTYVRSLVPRLSPTSPERAAS